MIQGAIMTRRIIEPDIPKNIKTKRSYLTSPGTARDIKNRFWFVQIIREIDNLLTTQNWLDVYPYFA